MDSTVSVRASSTQSLAEFKQNCGYKAVGVSVVRGSRRVLSWADPLPRCRVDLRVRVRASASSTDSLAELKKKCGYKAVDDHIRSGMKIGLGTGSTATFAVERVSELLKSGNLVDIVAVPTSIRTEEQARSLGIPLATLDEVSEIDVAVDGADTVETSSGQFGLVKGGGGALLREKMVEIRAKRFIVMVDESKVVTDLGPHFPLPVEITPFCHEHTRRVVEALPAVAGCKAALRMGSASTGAMPDGEDIAVTENGNYILDLHFEHPINDPVAAAEQLKSTVGVVEHGLFIGMTDTVIVSGTEGIEVLKAS